MKLKFKSSQSVESKMKLPYVCTVEGLQKQRELRKGPEGQQARSKALKFLRQEWGVDAGELELSGVWLPRQLARPDAEAFVTAVFAEMADMSPGILELTLDSLVDCAYKRSFINQVVLSEPEQRIFRDNGPMPENGTSLDELRTTDGSNISESLRTASKQVLGDMNISDISPFYSSVLEMNLDAAISGKVPAIDKVVLKKGKIIREFALRGDKYCCADQEYSLAEVKEFASQKLARPSAVWNYNNVYLMLPGILCPDAALVVTPFEFDPPKIRSSALAAIKRITEITGLPPMMLPMVSMSTMGTQEINRAKSMLGKYPEYAIFMLEQDTVRSVLGSVNGSASFVEASFVISTSLSEVASRKEIKMSQEKWR
jgi:hypothetical protein